MKKGNRILWSVWLLVLGLLLHAKSGTAVMICDYTGTDMDTIYNVYLQVNYATAFELPPGREIKHVVLGDPVNWRAKVDDDGKVCFVKPMEPNIRASLTIITTDNQVLVFNLVEVSGETEKQTIAKVRIVIHDDEFFISRNRPFLGAVTAQKKREDEILQFIRKKTKKYRLRHNCFFIENVCDDGIFTYVYVPKAQYRPAVFFSRGKKGDLEPIRYVDKGDYYVIHKVLSQKGDRFLLKLGKMDTAIALIGGVNES